MENKGSKEKKACDVSEVFDANGKFQVIQYFLISLVVMHITMVYINFVFVAGKLDYR